MKAFLEGLGYSVKGEIGGCDLVALRGDDPPIVVIGELKLSFNLELVLQANWPEKGPLTAVRFQCEKKGDVIVDRTFWGKRELTQVILVR